MSNTPSQQELYKVTVNLESGKTKTVFARAASQQTAERRAMKRTAHAVGVQQSEKSK